ncbi:ATP-binding protein [Alteromonas australica]|jgi:signal transduction histidine kinase/DNA-binding response OmpR family regulator|uniref:ATP-binding protein n=1 Tax=Alteromonas australica TaxID=589873 RepID=UPI000C4186D8|nr:hybrid sensor histidine kinase/response regulator [Alteromonas sp.]|tara:strand:+ start:1147 stop:5037 length:3891 start_codon:yes stop_codon:yes gene_type:complete
MDIKGRTISGNRTIYSSFVSIFVFLLSIYQHQAYALGVTLEGKNRFDGIPSGVIRDIEAVGNAVYIASENGVFELIGGKAEKLNFNDDQLNTGIISDIEYDNEGNLWIVEYGVGVFKLNIATRAVEEFIKSEGWKRFAWSLSIGETHVAVSIISGVYLVDKDTGKTEDWAGELGLGEIDKAYSMTYGESQFYVAVNDELIILKMDKRRIQRLPLQENFKLLSSLHHVTKTSDALYLGGKEGIYAVTDDKHAFIPFDVEIAKNINRVSDIYVSAGNEVWVAAGGMFQVYGDRLQSPSFMNPILNSDSIRSITKISESTTGDLLFASSQLGLVTLSNIHRGINLLHHNGQVLRSNVSDSGIDLSGEALLQVGSNNYVLNTGNGAIEEREAGNASACLDNAALIFEKVMRRSEPTFEYCKSHSFHTFYSPAGILYAYLWNGDGASYFLLDNDRVVDQIEAPSHLVFATLSNAGEIIAYDSKGNVHIQLSKVNWKIVNFKGGDWSHITCLVELSDSFLVCTSGMGLKEISKTTGEVSSSRFMLEEQLRFIRGGIISSNGQLWIASNMGLFVHDIEHKSTNFLGKQNGILDTDFEYGSLIQFGSKIVVLGDRYSYLIDEKKVLAALENDPENKPQAVFTKLSWDRSDSVNVYYMPPNSSGTYDIYDGYSDISIHIGTNSFRSYADQNIEFRIKGVFDEWVLHHDSYMLLKMSDLGAGQYELEARIRGKYSKGEISRLNLTIHPPFYASNMAFSFYAIALVLLFTVAKLGYLKPAVSFVRDTRIYQFLTRYELTDGQSKFEKMLRAKEQHIGDIAHELKTPLQLMFNTIENKKGVNGLEDATLTAMHENAKRIQNLVEQISSTAPSISSGVAIYKLYDVEKVKYVVTSLAPLADVKKQQLDVTVKGSSGISLINDSLEKIVTNLVENAIKYTPERGHIKVSAVLNQDSLRIVVSDNGEGIAENDHAKVLNRFARAHKGKEKGEGVGLALVNDLVKLNQGTMVLDSALSKGTKWIITLPLDDVDFINEEQSNGAKSKAWGERKTLLLIDDNRVFRTYLFNYFSDTYRCLIAKNGKQALSILKNYPVDLIISDLLMAPTNGIEFVQKLRHKPELASVPVIILTANTDEDAKRKALEAKVDHYLTKPVDNDELRLHVERLLSLRSIPHMQGRKLPQLGESLDIPELTSEKDMNFYLNFIEVLEKNYKNEYFSRDMAASMLTMSSRSLNRRLSELFEYNFSEFLTRFRVDKSIPLLLNGTTVIDACMEVGFGTPSYFSTSFKRVKGLPPRKFVDTKKVGENAPSAS